MGGGNVDYGLADIVLVSPYAVAQETRAPKDADDIYPQLGLLCLSAYLKRHKKTVQILDGTFGSQSQPEILKTQSPALVGITANLITRTRALQTIRVAAQAGSTVIAGGPDPVLAPEQYLAAGAAAVVKGEGEQSLLELIEYFQRHSTLQGVCLPGVITASCPNPSEREFIRVLDELPLPDYEAVDIRSYLAYGKKHKGYSILPVMSARGCPHHCTWCSKPVFGNSFRPRSAGHFVDELEKLMCDYAPDRVRVLDDVFPMNKTRIEQMAIEMEKRHLRIPFECLARTDSLDVERLRALKRMGCYRIWCGVESGSQKVLNAMRKGTQVEQARRAARLIHEADIELACFVMVGYPGETPKDVLATLKLIDEIRPERISVSVATPLRGTEFYEQVKHRIKNDAAWQRTSDYKIDYIREYPPMYYRFARQLVLKYWQYRFGALQPQYS